jgi:hypothetical protein
VNGILFQTHRSTYVLRGGAPRQDRGTAAGPATVEPRVPAALRQQGQQKVGQSVQASNVNSFSLDKMLKIIVVKVKQQIMTESNGAVLEEAKILASTKIVLNLMELNGH